MKTASELKAVILAAGGEASQPDGRPLVLATLGKRVILDYVVDNAHQVVQPDNLFVVVSPGEGEIQAHLGSGYRYVVQEERRGTGHAVLQLRSHLRGYKGDLLILYGDTPLFRPGSIRGLLNRHRLRQASLTLATLASGRLPWWTRTLPYGRVIRDAGGRIVGRDRGGRGVGEGTADSGAELRGAYVVRTEAIFSGLGSPGARGDGDLRVTDRVHQLIRLGAGGGELPDLRPGRGAGDQHPDDLAQAEVDLQERGLPAVPSERRTRSPLARPAGGR